MVNCCKSSKSIPCALIAVFCNSINLCIFFFVDATVGVWKAVLADELSWLCCLCLLSFDGKDNKFLQMILDNLIEEFKDPFDAHRRAQDLFTNNSEEDVQRKIQQLAKAQGKLESLLQEKVRSNYGLFVGVSTEVGVVEKQLSELKAYLERIHECVQQVRNLELNFDDEEIIESELSSSFSSSSSSNPGSYWRAGETASGAYVDGLPLWLLESPRALQRCLAEHTYSEAVDIVCKVREFRWNSKLSRSTAPTIKRIRNTAERVASILSTQLLDSLTVLPSAPMWGEKERTGRLKELIRLGHAGTAAEGFLAGQSAGVTRAVHRVSTSGDVESYAGDLSSVFYIALRATVRSFLAVFRNQDASYNTNSVSNMNMNSNSSITSRNSNETRRSKDKEDTRDISVATQLGMGAKSIPLLLAWIHRQTLSFVGVLAGSIEREAIERTQYILDTCHGIGEDDLGIGSFGYSDSINDDNNINNNLHTGVGTSLEAEADVDGVVDVDADALVDEAGANTLNNARTSRNAAINQTIASTSHSIFQEFHHDIDPEQDETGPLVMMGRCFISVIQESMIVSTHHHESNYNDSSHNSIGHNFGKDDYEHDKLSLKSGHSELSGDDGSANDVHSQEQSEQEMLLLQSAVQKECVVSLKALLLPMARKVITAFASDAAAEVADAVQMEQWSLLRCPTSALIMTDIGMDRNGTNRANGNGSRKTSNLLFSQGAGGANPFHHGHEWDVPLSYILTVSVLKAYLNDCFLFLKVPLDTTNLDTTSSNMNDKSNTEKEDDYNMFYRYDNGSNTSGVTFSVYERADVAVLEPDAVAGALRIVLRYVRMLELACEADDSSISLPEASNFNVTTPTPSRRRSTKLNDGSTSARAGSPGKGGRRSSLGGVIDTEAMQLRRRGLSSSWKALLSLLLPSLRDTLSYLHTAGGALRYHDTSVDRVIQSLEKRALLLQAAVSMSLS